ncbi:MAG: sulfur carrier protein ThiS [Alphaproteobacteria bacterium]|nr:sulfur carrier protein ThiS [Alphaproteobacteria bacterium]
MNGEAHVTEAASLSELLASMGITMEMPGIAVACNGMVAPRAVWSAQSLRDQDQIEVIRANIGG